MWIFILTMSYLLAYSSGINFIDIPNPDVELPRKNPRRYQPKTNDESSKLSHWLFRQSEIQSNPDNEEKDADVKKKINILVQQSLHDTGRKINSIKTLKDNYRDLPPYRMGFILNMIKRSRDVLNELFNVAVKHRDDWKALEQLRVFEMVVHTNVDTTNLVRQLVEIHIQYMNSTTTTTEPGPLRNMVSLRNNF